MGSFIEFIIGFVIDVIKKFALEIVVGLLLFFARRHIPGLRSLYTKQKRRGDASLSETITEEDLVRAELERKKEELAKAEVKKAELQMQLEAAKARTSRLKPTGEAEQSAMSDEELVRLFWSGDVQRIEAAIMSGADVNARDDNVKNSSSKTGLMWAARMASVTSASLLLKYGADVNAKDKNGMTALMFAAESRCADIAGMLIAYGAEVDAKDYRGMTALMMASNLGRTETAKLLLKHGADVNARDNINTTALMGAARHGYTRTARFLLKHGADAKAEDNLGRTALMLAKENKRIWTALVLWFVS